MNSVNPHKMMQSTIQKLKTDFPDVTPRFERKFRLNNLIKETIKYRLFSMGFMENFPERKVNSCYFDRSNFDFAQDNINGVNKRLKIRSRWYEDKFGKFSKHKLEFKCKEGFLGYKYIVNLNNNKKETIQNIVSTTGLNVDASIETSYNRIYFISSGGIRATLDYNLGARLPYTKNSHISLDYSVLEIKYPTNLDNYFRSNVLSNLVKFFPIRMNKSSKYVEALSKFRFV